jgi:hypothetical protein
MDMLVSHGNGLARALPIDLPDNEPYLLLPEPLALDLRDSPLAVGIYMLVGRAFLVHQGPIPLSATDIESYDGSGDLRRGAILRALTRLCTGGYLLPQSKQGRGLKTTYIPGWGRVSGTARPWSFDAAGLDRPRSVRAVRVPRSLLDVGMGRLIPHVRHAAIIERYVTRPPISLRDLGAYGLSWAGITIATPALTRLGVVNESGPIPPPAWNMLLARISQQPLFDADPTAPGLSPRGLKQAGFHIDSAATTDDPSPLFFVPTDLIGAMIPSMIPASISPMIALSDSDDTALSASRSDESRPENSHETTTGTQGTQGIVGNEATSSATATDPVRGRSSLSVNSISKVPQPQPSKTCVEPSPEDLAPAGTPSSSNAASTPTPATPAEEMLRNLGVYPSIARQYRDLSPDLIERAHTIAQRLPGRKSTAATIAQLLREEQGSPGWLRQGRPDLFLSPMREKATAVVDQDASSGQIDEDPCAHAHTLLCDALGEHLSIFIERWHMSFDADQIVVQVPAWFSPTERAEVRIALGLVTDQLDIPVVMPVEELSLPEPAPRPDGATPEHMPVRPSEPKNERPDWISPEQWAKLHLIARGALSGSCWVDGEIVGSGPGTTRILRGNLAGLVARLCGAVDKEHTLFG